VRKQVSRRLGLPLRHPATLIATGFGIGRLPAMPGSWGSLAALPLAWAVRRAFGAGGLALAAAAVATAGIWAAGGVAEASGMPDPGSVVIDEIAGQMLVLLPLPRDPGAGALAFLLFRLFDIWKPWPIRRVERAVGGGLGIMLDDMLAAGYAVLAQRMIGGIFGVRP
jgi:phosphatidylglycerophosphatase A